MKYLIPKHLLTLCIITATFTPILRGDITVGFHGHNDASALGGPSDMNLTDVWLWPQLGEPIRNRLGTTTTVLDLVGVRNSGDGTWAFDEVVRAGADPAASPDVTELVVLANWEADAVNGGISAQSAGQAFAEYLIQQRPDWIERFGDIAVVGQSRGAAALDGAVEAFGKRNILVDSATTLDTVPDTTLGDVSPIKHRDNTMFFQNFREQADLSFFWGQPVEGAVETNITAAYNGPCGLGDCHLAVQTFFGDTIDTIRETEFSFGGTIPERSETGGALLHFGNRAHVRSAKGLHPSVGGGAPIIANEVMVDESWPAIAATQYSRAAVHEVGPNEILDISFIFSHPNPADLTITALLDSNRNLLDEAMEIELATSTLSPSATLLPSSFTVAAPGEEGQYFIHLQITDGQLARHTTLALTVVPEPSSSALALFASVSFCLAMRRPRSSL